LAEHEINSFHAHCNIKNAKNQFYKPVLENILLKIAYKIKKMALLAGALSSYIFLDYK